MPSKYFLPSAPYGASEGANALNPTQQAAVNPQTPLLPPTFQDPGKMLSQTVLQNAQPAGGAGGGMGNPLGGVARGRSQMFGRGLFGMLLLFMLVPSLFATTTVTGTINNLGTGAIGGSGAFVRFWLRGCGGNQPRVNGTAVIGPTQGGVFFFDLAANASGVVSGTIYSTRDATGLLGGDIECGGVKTSVWYGMQIFVSGKGGPEVAIHALNAGTLDISNVTPITTNPVITAPTGDSTYLRKDAGNSPLTGPLTSTSTISDAGGTHSGTETFTGLLCAQQLGNPTGAIQIVGCGTNTTIQAAITAIPSSGGKVLIPPGTYAFSDTTLNKANLIIEGSGASTVITPTGGAGHYAFILGDANPSTVNGLKLLNLAITCPGGADGTSGILVHKGVSIGTVLEKLKIRQCATHILWGDQTGGTQSAFSGMIRDNDIDLVGAQIGIDLNVGPNGSNGANGITIEGNSIRNGTLDTGLSIGIRVNGQAQRTSILNNYMEYEPGGVIVLRNTYGGLNRTIIMNNYMETFTAGGLLLDIGNGVSDTIFENNYSNQITTPSNFAIKIANGATGIWIANNTFQNEATAVINNLNTNSGAGIVLYNNDHFSGAAPWFDSSTGIIQQTYTGSFATLQTNPIQAIQAYNAGAGKQLQFLEPTSGATQYNWRAAASFCASNSFDITPSTAVGGLTFSNPALCISQAGNVNIPGSLSVGGVPVAGSGFTGVNVTPVTVSANVATDQNLMALTIPAGALNSVNRTLLVQLAGVYSTPAASTTTVQLKIKLCTVSGCGSGTVLTLANLTSAALGAIQATNDPFNVTFNISTQTAGAAAAFEAHGNLTIDISALSTAAEGVYGDNNTATIGTIDTTAQLFLQVTIAFSAASGSNSATQRQLIAVTVD